MINSFKTLNEANILLKTIGRFEDGEMIYIDSEEKYYTYCAEKDDFIVWEPNVEGQGGFKLNAYEINQQVYTSLPTMSEQDILDFINHINLHYKDEYYMLVNNTDINYYTVFIKKENENETLGELLVECLNNIGYIKGIEITENHIELWVKPINYEYAVALYFFNYSQGIVPFGG